MIYSYMITKNERDRYLFMSVIALMEHVDGLVIYDDRSDDMTVDDIRFLCNLGNVSYVIRNNLSLSFIENEAAFRADAWTLMEKTFHPRSGDWILTLDADEFLRCERPLQEICEQTPPEVSALRCPVREVWGTGDDDQMRVDGAWGGINALRLCRYVPGASFKIVDEYNRRVPMGRGSLPNVGTEYYDVQAIDPRFDILHYGYALAADRELKHRRYSSRLGHTGRHVKSIIEPAVLAPLPALGYDTAA